MSDQRVGLGCHSASCKMYLMGRNTKYSPQMQAALCQWLKKGCSFKDACAMEGISYETFRTWQGEKSVFSPVGHSSLQRAKADVAIKKAEIECKVARIQTTLKASDKSWQAAAWWLERRYGDEYGRNIAKVVVDSPLVLRYFAHVYYIIFGLLEPWWVGWDLNPGPIG